MEVGGRDVIEPGDLPAIYRLTTEMLISQLKTDVLMFYIIMWSNDQWSITDAR